MGNVILQQQSERSNREASRSRQFVALPFAVLDGPGYLGFVRSPEYSTYLLMRQFIWRSLNPHPAGLHTHYAEGRLTATLDHTTAAARLGVSVRTVRADIAALVQRGAIRIHRTGRHDVYELGRWNHDGGGYTERYYADDGEPGGEILHTRHATSCMSDMQLPAGMLNTETNTEQVEIQQHLVVNPACASEGRRVVVADPTQKCSQIAPEGPQTPADVPRGPDMRQATESATEPLSRGMSVGRDLQAGGEREDPGCALEVEMVELGVTESTARELVRNYPPELIEAQLAALWDRRPANPAAMLVAAIRGRWTLPASHTLTATDDERARDTLISPARCEQVSSPDNARAPEAPQEPLRAPLSAAEALVGNTAPLAAPEPLQEPLSTIQRPPEPFMPFRRLRCDSRQVWAMVLGELGGEAHDQFRHARLVGREDDELVVEVQTAYHAAVFNRRLSVQIGRILSALGGEDVRVRFQPARVGAIQPKVEVTL